MRLLLLFQNGVEVAYSRKLRYPDSASIAVGANTNPKAARCAAAEGELDGIARDIMDGRARILDRGRCAYCMACVHFCPRQTMTIRGRRVRPELQYRHPGVTAADLVAAGPCGNLLGYCPHRTSQRNIPK